MSPLTSGRDSVQAIKPVSPSAPAARIPPVNAIVAVGAATPRWRNLAPAVAA